MKLHLLKLFMPPLVGLVCFSTTIIITGLVFSDFTMTDYELTFYPAFVLAITIFGYPIAFIANLIGMFIVDVLKEYSFYRPSILVIFGFLIGASALILYADKLPDYQMILAIGVAGISASLSYYYFDKKYPEPMLEEK